jgi:hypothetical protein
MTETRFSFNPFNDKFIFGGLSHNQDIYNSGNQKSFDNFIRGIILNNTLYLRLYYPFEDLENLSLNELKRKSYTLLKDNEKKILSLINDKLKVSINVINYNVDNDLLRGLQLANI